MDTFYKSDFAGRLAFMGKITSNVTHELNNVFSIINEYTGMIEDKIYAAMNGSDFDVEKVLYYKEKIQNQIERGKELNKRLNYFSHSADNTIINFELNEALTTLALLLKRFVLMKEMNLLFVPYQKEIRLSANLFVTEHRFFIIIFCLLDFLDKNAEIVISIQKNDNDQYQIAINNESFSNELLDELKSIINDRVNNYNDYIEIKLKDNKFEILLDLAYN